MAEKNKSETAPETLPPSAAPKSPEKKPKVTIGRIVIATIAIAGKLAKKPALVGRAEGQTIGAHVFIDGMRPGDFGMTQWQELVFDEGGKTNNSWAWPARE